MTPAEATKQAALGAWLADHEAMRPCSGCSDTGSGCYVCNYGQGANAKKRRASQESSR